MMRSFAGVVAPAHDGACAGCRCSSDRRHPFQPRAQVGFHAAHQVPGRCAGLPAPAPSSGERMKWKWCRSSAQRSLEGVEVGGIGLVARRFGPAWLPSRPTPSRSM